MPAADPNRNLRRALRLLALALLAAVVTGCPARIDSTRWRVHELNLRGARQVDHGDVRGHIATQETPEFPANHPRWLRWWRWWWVDPAYYDEAALNRDRLRIQRYYQSRGFYDTHVGVPRLTQLSRRRLNIDLDITEGAPTLVTDVRLHGCEEGDQGPLTAQQCRELRADLQLIPGNRFDEAAFNGDRSRLHGGLRERGWATPVVIPRAVVDPSQRRAWVEYTLRPGPRSRFGEVRLHVAPSTEVYTADRLPNGLPVSVIRSALGIDRGSNFSLRRLARGQQALLDLGVFGIARILEDPRPDGTVALDVTLSPGRLFRVRLGGGVEVDGSLSRNNVHALVTLEHRNFLGGFRRGRLEIRPELYFNLAGANNAIDGLVPGISTLGEISQPEIFRRVRGLFAVGFDLGPDPLLQSSVYRRALRFALGIEGRLGQRLTGGAFVRYTSLGFSPNPLSDPSTQIDLDREPLFRQQFFDQGYLYLEQTVAYDRRNDRARPTQGYYLSAALSESLRIPVLSDYTFVRAALEARAYVPVTRKLTFAVRGMIGGAVGESRFENGIWYWPVPPDLRFFSGGAQSNRGYPTNRVGVLGGIPGSDIVDGQQAWREQPNRVLPLGGVAVWEASVELRWQPGNLGGVLFFDASNVAGVNPEPFVSPAGQASTTCGRPRADNAVQDSAACVTNRDQAVVPPPQGWTDGLIPTLFRTANPSLGLGLRYLTPVGPIRIDFALRLQDLFAGTCTRAANDVAAQNAASPSGHPSWYLTTQPRCDFVGADIGIPAMLHFSIGEAW